MYNTPQTLPVDALKGLVARNASVRLNEEYKGTSVRRCPDLRAPDPDHRCSPSPPPQSLPGPTSARTASRSCPAAVPATSASALSLLRLDATPLTLPARPPDRPSHSGFVGEGLLGAAVCGNVFASPNTNQIKKGLELIDNDKGIVMVVPQYTGDVLHFGLAKEQYSAAHPNSQVRILFVGEDVSVGRSQGKMVGRRGLAAAVLCYKLAGALAEQGADVDAVYDVAKFVADSTATLGVGLEHCHVRRSPRVVASSPAASRRR